MDWENESYVKLYVREGTDELRMGWEGWALFQKLLRHSDRSGLFEYSGDDDLPVLAAMARMPLEVVERALPRIIKAGSVVVTEGALLVKGKLTAQEARKSDRLRQQESRARRRDVALATVCVTKRDGSVTKRDQTSHAVTRGHDSSHDVTLSRAEQSIPEQSRENTHGPSGKPDRAREIAVIVCQWIASETKYSPRPTGKEMQKLGQALARAGATDEEIAAALQLKRSEWARNDSDGQPMDRFWGKPATVRRTLPAALEAHRSGAKPEAPTTHGKPQSFGRGRVASREEHRRDMGRTL